jgi:hypothetical protein
MIALGPRAVSSLLAIWAPEHLIEVLSPGFVDTLALNTLGINDAFPGRLVLNNGEIDRPKLGPLDNLWVHAGA